MAITRTSNPNFMNGVPELLILRLLSKQEMYGYELVQAISDYTRQTISLGEGVVYPVLHGLEAGGYLKARRKAVGGRTRVYYAITAAGQRRLKEMASTWQKITTAITGIMEGRPHVPA